MSSLTQEPTPPRSLSCTLTIPATTTSTCMYDMWRTLINVDKTFYHTSFSKAHEISTTVLSFRYHRCQFELPIQPDSQPGSSGSERARQYITPVPDPVTVTAFSSWEDIAEKIKPSERPVVLNRSSSTNTTNPFGSTFCYGYQGLRCCRRWANRYAHAESRKRLLGCVACLWS